MSEAALLEAAAKADLEQAAGRAGVADAGLGSLTTIGCGGTAALMIEAVDAVHLSAILAAIQRHSLPWFVLGLGSNLLVADAGWPGVVIKLTDDLKSVSVRGNRLRCGAGAALSRAAAAARSAGLAGLEPLAGIPGTVGGAVAMNAGAFGASIGALVESLEICLPGEAITLNRDMLKFGYRSAALPPGGVVSRAVLLLTPADPAAVAARMREVRARRETSQPAGRSCGSVFRNPGPDTGAGLSAGQLLDEAGCKGMTQGGAAVSSRHANFIVNAGGARTADVLELMSRCRRRVFERTGIVLEPEVRLVGPIGLEPLS
ncbi:MAG: UDP-N-acetylmuramate dehydrogenase [Thermoleophilia bacterium]